MPLKIPAMEKYKIIRFTKGKTASGRNKPNSFNNGQRRQQTRVFGTPDDKPESIIRLAESFFDSEEDAFGHLAPSLMTNPG